MNSFIPCKNSGSAHGLDPQLLINGLAISNSKRSYVMLDFQFDFRYEGEEIPALKNAAGQIRRGSCIVLCGSSGCGKSSLLRCFNHLVPQFYEGELEGFCYIDGRDTEGLSIGQVGELAASVFQDPRSQFFTVNSNTEVAFGMENHGIPKDVIVRRVDEAFARFSLERLRDRNVYEMSSGERQFVSIPVSYTHLDVYKRQIWCF